MGELLFRPGDTCPACGSSEVFAGITRQAHAGLVHIDGCASCQKLWERETRSNPAIEPCTNCAWLKGSPEMATGQIYGIVNATIDGHGIFYCHRRVPFEIKGQKHGGFEHVLDQRKQRCKNASVCAGWIKAKLREKRSANERDVPAGSFPQHAGEGAS